MLMERGESESNLRARARSASDEVPAASRPPRFLRVGLWQAIAGMSFAITLAAIIVVAEMSRMLAYRTYYVNRRVAALNAIVRDLRRQGVATQRKLGSERAHASVGEVFEKILFAPDLRTIKLVAPQDKSGAQSDGVHAASGRLAMSESAGGAMLEASGLKPSENFKVYRIWWMPKHGAAVWAADFLVGDDGLATVPVDLPPARLKESSITVTLENETYAEAPTGPVALKGDAAHAEHVANPRRKR
jgi:Anti-sigma-K factor rskA